MSRYSALVAGASMPVAAQVSLTGVRNPLASCKSSNLTASYHVEGVDRQHSHDKSGEGTDRKNGGRLALFECSELNMI